MDYEPSPSESQKPTALRSFMRGFGASALNSGLFLSILGGVMWAASFVGLVVAPGLGFLVTLGLASAASGLFGGIMAIREKSQDATSRSPGIVPLPVSGMSSPAPSVALPSMGAVTQIDAAEAPVSKNWVNQTGRNADAQSRIQEILNQGAISDKDRAGALLAAREAANSSTPPTRA